MPDTSAADPASYFLDLAGDHPRCFWLDGGGARAWSGRRSIIGHLEPGDVSLTYDAVRREVTRHVDGGAEVVGDDPFSVLETELKLGPPDAQWFGYFGYAARPDLPALTGHGGGLPDAVWMRPSTVRLFVHEPAPTDAATGPAARHDDVGLPSPEYAEAFARVQEHLRAGNSYEVNLTFRRTVDGPVDPAAAYLRLRDLNPAPYAGFLQHDVEGARGWLLSSSPERYALLTTDRVLETKPIKGTTPRGDNPIEDDEARRRLATDPKLRAENLMITDLLRHDVAGVCAPGTVEVPELMAVESYPSVHQLVTTIRGRLAADVSPVEALRSLFPAGSMTGAPKLRTMEIIAQVESTPRGPYAGAFGWISADGRADLGVIIRSLMTTGDGRWTLGTGGGITVRSVLEEEWAEAAWKAERLLRAVHV